MRLGMIVVLLASSCISIHTVDFAMRRPTKGSSCDVPMNKGGQVPDGWQAIGYVTIQGAAEWTETQFANEFRTQACLMGADYVVVAGAGNLVQASFLMQTQPTQPQPNQPMTQQPDPEPAPVSQPSGL